ncbi:hypothetical protein AB0M28_14600 [Streptomyces sp. NPDC051940]|uniref:hypothetical protein n=1 Tax=Streptomyces sp. NPDC051940 TaxID=3155675 RepID=UPI0034473686
MKPQLVMVHGIGSRRDTDTEQGAWLDALAAGLRAAERDGEAAALLRGALADVRFANYSDLFDRPGAQGEPADALDDADAPFLADLLGSLLDGLDEQFPAGEYDPDSAEREALDDARFRVEAVLSGRQAQGAGEPVRVLVGAATSILSLPVLRKGAQWMSGRAFLFQLAQVGRYLDRSRGGALGQAVRERILDGTDPDRPLVVVSHSLGTVVAYEALHEHPGPVPLWVTLGSPLALGAVVLDRLVPRPAQCPETVGAWRNYWDRDDIVVGRPELAKWVAPSSTGVAAVTAPVTSSGLWVHTATKYLEHRTVAEPVAEALRP